MDFTSLTIAVTKSVCRLAHACAAFNIWSYELEERIAGLFITLR